MSFWRPVILKGQKKNKIQLLDTPADNKHKHNADVMKKACFHETIVYSWEQFSNA